MISIPGYLITKKIWDSPNSVLYRGVRESDKAHIVIKILSSNKQKSVKEIEQFEHEYQFLQRLHGEGAPFPYGFEKLREGMAIIEEDCGTSLQEMIIQNKLDLKEFLIYAIKITEALDKIHSHSIIHKDINPSNIVYDTSRQQIKIIDLGLATNLPREVAEIRNIDFFHEGTLSYISPEQTGRMNRGIDYRTDYYSLGVTFYEMATGHLPFVAKDILEVMHAHIAKLPLPPHEIAPSIPTVVSDIILKLLSKRAEQRYQSLFGLKVDLQKCLDELEANNRIGFFAIGLLDVSSRFSIPEKLYGREKELSLLLQKFNDVVIGKTELMLVAGFSGIGKSSLIHELYKPLMEKKGLFISGKFDQFSRNIPYSAMTQAIQELVQQLLTKSEESLFTWKEKILKALGPNGKVVTDLVPMLSAIIGEQPPVPEVGSVESENRFKSVLTNLIHALAQPDHPLVLFLDDCQWADSSSLNLIQTLLLNSGMRHLMIIASYRDNEVNENHIFIKSIELLKSQNIVTNTVKVLPLVLEDIQQLIADMAHQGINESVMALAEISFEKTQGNPFFLNQFLQTLYKDALIEFDTKKGEWKWDVEKVRKQDITSNVIEFMVQKIKQLPSKTQYILQLAACLGNRFDLEKLTIIREVSRKEVLKELQDALTEGLILNVGDNFHFLHDRVQQAAHSLIADKERNLIHLKIGRLLLKSMTPSTIEESILEVVKHFNYGVDIITEESEKVELSELNLKSGNKAKDSIAYKVALDHYRVGIDLLHKNGWNKYYELYFDLHVRAIEAACLAFEHEEIITLMDAALLHAKNLLDKIRVYTPKIAYLSSQYKYQEAMEVGFVVLKMLKINIPPKPNMVRVIYEIMRIKWKLKGKSIEDLYNLPEMTDPIIKASASLLIALCPVAYLVNPVLYMLLGFRGLELTIKYGNDPKTSGLFYVTYGYILLGGFKQIDLGYQYALLSLRVLDRFKNTEPEKVTASMLVGYIVPSKKHLDNSLELLSKTYHRGLETGNVDYASYAALCYQQIALYGGKELKNVIKEMYSFREVLSKQKALGVLSSLHLHFALSFIGSADEIMQSQGILYDEANILDQFLESNDTIGLVSIYRSNLVLLYFFNDYVSAYEYALKLAPYKSLDQVGFLEVNFRCFASLANLACYREVNKKTQRAILKSVKKNLKELKFFAKYAPMNCLNKCYLVEAELANIHNQYKRAVDYYCQAIILAHESKFIHEEALANERAAYFYLNHNQEKVAKVYLQEAYLCYQRWGAAAKVKQLEEKYPELIKEKTVKSISIFDTQSSSVSSSMSGFVDIFSLMKSTQTITNEIELSTLLKKMMQIVIENAGAQKGYFLAEKEGTWYIEAEAFSDREDVTVLQSAPIRNILPVSIIQYVTRSRTALALNDATTSDQFSADPYIQRCKPKSILCMPLLNQGVLSSILYMENNLATDIFTQERLDILNLLLGQIISAIDNAKLYRDLKELNRAQESFVPKELIKLLGKKSITEVVLGDQVKREMTVMFCDIRDFTSITEKLPPDESMKFINDFLARMEPVITYHHGVIDKYIGDAIMALFPEKADDAVRCGISMLNALDEYNNERLRAAPNEKPIRIGIGLNTGLLMIGTVGTTFRMEGTVIADAVNVASRTETLTKTYRTPLLITEETYKQLSDQKVYAIRKIDNSVYVKGKAKPIVIYEVFDHEAEEIVTKKYENLAPFETALNLFWNKNYAEAGALFKIISEASPSDKPAALYYEKCNNLNLN